MRLAEVVVLVVVVLVVEVDMVRWSDWNCRLKMEEVRVMKGQQQRVLLCFCDKEPGVVSSVW